MVGQHDGEEVQAGGAAPPASGDMTRPWSGHATQRLTGSSTFTARRSDSPSNASSKLAR